MNIEFKTSAQPYIYHFLIGIPLFILSFIMLCFYASKLWLIILLAIPLFAAISLIYNGICNIQFVDIEDGVIRSYNLFGTITTVNVADIKRAFYVESRAIRIPGIEKYMLCIVVSESETLRKRMVRRAYNRVDDAFVVIPYGRTNKRLIKEAYFEATGEELEITS